MKSDHDGSCEFEFRNAFALMNGNNVLSRCGRPATHRAKVQYGDGLEYACDMHTSCFLHWEKLATPETSQ